MPDTAAADYFKLFNEIGIIEQLSRAFLEAQLPEGLIAPHFAVLNHLIRVKDGQTPLVLARAFQVPKTSMTHTLAGLEKRGLVIMKPNPDDARSKQVWLQEAGRAVREAAIVGMGSNFEALRGVVSPEELGQVLPVLERVRKHLDAARN